VSRRTIVGAAIAIAAVIAWWLARGSDDRRAGSPAAPTRAPERAAVSAPSSPMLDEPSAHPDRGPEAMPEIPLDPPAPPPYPPGSQPLTEGVDPASAATEDDPVDSDHPFAMHAVFGARKDVVHPPDPLVLDLDVFDAKRARLPVTGAYARFRSEKSTPDGPWFRTELADDGHHHYVASYAPSTTARDALLGFRIFVEVGFEAPNGLGRRVYGMTMMYTDQPHGHLNGRFTEDVVDGSLIIGAGATIEAPGQWKAIASLYAADGQTAIVFAQNSVHLDAGDRFIPLTFFGKILRDKGLDGPYVLRYMMLFEEHPDRGVYLPGVTVDPAYTTHPYEVAQFSPAPYVAPPPSGPQVTADSPSQRGKPPPTYGAADRARGSLGGPAGSGSGSNASPLPR
jgi:hypothetical protein